jgi:Major Facilitator Superfamily
VAAYSVGLGIATVIIPLLALDAGYDPAAVGLLVAVAAGCQFTARLALPMLLGRFPDRALIGLASLAMVGAFGLLLGSTALPIFVIAQLLQGISRAIFWTSSQTHAIRGGGRPLQRLVDVNAAGSLGTLSGPAIGGMLAVIGLPLALAVAAVASSIAAIATLGMHTLPPYDRRRSAGTRHLLARDGVDIACWASAVTGGWWSMMGSYVPVLGVAAGFGPAEIGWLITLAEGSGMAAILLLRRMPSDRVRVVVRLAAVVVIIALVGLAAVALSGTPAVAALFAILLVVGGAASGTATTLAPALANVVARSDEQGDVLALTGTFRAAALLGVPATIGLLLAVTGVPAAVAVVAVGLGLPGLLVGRRSPEARPETAGAP